MNYFSPITLKEAREAVLSLIQLGAAETNQRMKFVCEIFWSLPVDEQMIYTALEPFSSFQEIIDMLMKRS